MAKISSDPPLYDNIVLGAGMSGLTLAYELNARRESVCLIDEYDSPGGNHISDNIDGMSFDIGTIFHWSESPLFEMFPTLQQQCQIIEWNAERINPQRRVVAYPYDVSGELLVSSPLHIARVLLGILKNRVFSPPPNSAEAFLHHYLGRELTESSGIAKYIERLYGLHPAQVSYEFAQARMQHIAKVTSISARLRAIYQKLAHRSENTDQRKRETNHCLARPKSGFASFYQAALLQLTDCNVDAKLGEKIYAITREDNLFNVVTRMGVVKSRRIYGTIPLEIMAKAAAIPTSSPPTSLDLFSVYYRFKGKLGFRGPVLYNFQKQGRWKRVTLHSQYYGEVNGWSYFTVETTALKEEQLSLEFCQEDFLKSIEGVDVLKGEIECVGSRITDFGYPLFDQYAVIRREALKSSIEKFGIICVGRQGAFEYIPVTHVAADNARRVVERVVG